MKQNYNSLDNLDVTTSQTTVQLNRHKQTKQFWLLGSFMQILIQPTWLSSALCIAKLWPYNFLFLFDMIPPTFWCMNFEIAKKTSTFKMKYSLCGVESENCSILYHSQDLDFNVSLCLVTHNFLSNIPFAYFYIIMSEWHSILFFIVCLASQAPSYCRKVVHIIIIINIIITPT